MQNPHFSVSLERKVGGAGADRSGGGHGHNEAFKQGKTQESIGINKIKDLKMLSNAPVRYINRRSQDPNEGRGARGYGGGAWRRSPSSGTSTFVKIRLEDAEVIWGRGEGEGGCGTWCFLQDAVVISDYMIIYLFFIF